jgi:hypothetical protein
MSVDSIIARNVFPTGKAYVMASAIENIDENDLEFQEAANYIDNALSSKGYIKKGNKEDADILITLSYGLGSPNKSYQTETQPGMIMPIYGIWMASPTRSQTVEVITYPATMIVEAYNLRDTNRKSPLWKTITKMAVFKPNIRAVLPYMVAASSIYYGVNTGQEIMVTIKDDDPNLLNIRK